MTGSGKYVEIQGTGEETPFSPEQLAELLELAKKGTQELIRMQKEALGEHAELVGVAEQVPVKSMGEKEAE
jgi:ribonuclease PH